MKSSSGAGVATGTVSFFDGGSFIGIGTIDATGVAAFVTGSLPVGTHSITATYAGDSNFTGSDNLSSPLSQTVNKSNTSGNLTRSTKDAKQPLTLTAIIIPTPPGGGFPSGSVTFVIDGVVRGTVGTTNGQAQLFLPDGLSQGTHTIVLKYLGDGSFAASNTAFTLSFGGRAV